MDGELIALTANIVVTVLANALVPAGRRVQPAE